MAPDDRDPTVKELLSGKPLSDVVDEATARELERWFGLPSFQQVADAEPAIDPGIAAVLAQRAKAVAAVDPTLLAAIARRSHHEASELLHFEASLQTHIDPDLPIVDLELAERGLSIAEPREVELPDALLEDLKECTPQALLRDLHRAELMFEKMFEIVDYAAEQRFDIVAEVKSAMATSWKLPPLGALPFREASGVVDEIHATRRTPWPQLWTAKRLPNRRIVE